MKKVLLSAVCAMWGCVSAFAAPTPVECAVQIPTGSEVEIAESINLKFVDLAGNWLQSGWDVCTVNPDLKVIIKNDKNTFESSSVTAGIANTIVSPKFTPAIKTPGVYDIVIPEGLMIFDNGTKTNAAVTLPNALTILGSSVTVTQSEYMAAGVYIDPADNSTLTSGNIFTLVNTCGQFKVANTVNVELIHPDGLVEARQGGLIADNTQLQMQFTDGLKEPGRYTLRIPEGAYTATLNEPVGTTLNPELVFHYTVAGSEKPEDKTKVDVLATVSPLNTAVEAASFSEFFVKLTASGADLPSGMYVNEKLVSNVIVKSELNTYVPASVIVADGASSTIRLVFEIPVSSGGDYSIYLPEGLVCWEKNFSSAVTLENAFKCTAPVVKYFTGLQWSQGSTWTNRLPVINMEVEKFGGVYGEFTGMPADADLKVEMDSEDPDMALSLKKVKILLPDGNEVERGLYKVAQTNNAFRFTAKAEGAYDIPGQYKVTIPAGAFTAGGQSNPEITAMFTLEDKRVFNPIELPWIINPDCALELDELTYVWIVMDNRDEEGKAIYRELGIKYGSKASVVSNATGETFEYPIHSYTFGLITQTGFAFDLVPDIQTAGTYTVTIPAGVYLLRRESDDQLVTNEELIFTYKVKGTAQTLPVVNLNPTVTPASGNVVSLGKFEFFRPAGYQMFIPDPKKEFVLTCPDGSEIKATPYTNNNVAGDFAFLQLPENVTAPGKYILTIPEGGFLIQDSSEKFSLLAEKKYEYEIITSVPVDMAHTVSPADGSKLYFLDYAYVKFDEPVNYVNGSVVKLIDPKGVAKDARCSFNKDNNRLMLEFGIVSELGQYTFVIPQGTVYNGKGEVNKEIRLTYELIEREVVDVPFIITPAPGDVSEKFTKVTITIPADYKSCTRPAGGMTKAQFYINDDAPQPLYIYETDNPMVYEIKFPEPLTQRCDVTIEIPEEAFRLTTVGGAEVINAATRLNWRVVGAGAVEISSEDGLYNVFNADGVCVLRNGNADDLNKLAKGLYIINGKTVIIR